MDAWEGEKLINTNGRSKNTLASVEGGVTSKRGRKRSPPALLKTVNGAELDGEVTDPDDELEARGEERDSSSDSSESSNSSSTSASSSGSSSGGSRSHHHHRHVRSVRGPKGGTGLGPHSQMWEQDEQGEYIVITCAENEAKLYKERFGRGSIGRSVLFRSRWLTPNEFQAVSGRQSSKDWKRSIRLRGRCLKEYINDGLFKEHEKSCLCKVCLGGDTELLRQEGVIALAAKRRRLSHADSGFGQQLHTTASGGGTINSNNATIIANSGTSSTPNAASAGELTPPTSANNVATPTAAANMASTLAEGTSERRLPGSTGLGAKRKRKSGPRGNKKSQQRVWSPSGGKSRVQSVRFVGDGGLDFVLYVPRLSSLSLLSSPLLPLSPPLSPSLPQS